MEKSLAFYQLLGYDEVLEDQTSIFSDWSNIARWKSEYRRVLLSQKKPSGGGFSKLAGKSFIELVQDTSKRSPKKFMKIDCGGIQDLFT
jgi:preprotein translocase subunit Sss1